MPCRPPGPSQETMQENKNTTLQLVTISYQEVLHGESNSSANMYMTFVAKSRTKNEPTLFSERTKRRHPSEMTDTTIKVMTLGLLAPPYQSISVTAT